MKLLLKAFRNQGKEVTTLKKLIIGLSALSLLALTTVPALAVDPANINLTPTDQFKVLNQVTLPGFVKFGIQAVLIVAGLVFFFMLVWGGIEWILAGGDKAGAENARKRITNALIGLAIVFSAWGIITLIKVIFNVDIMTLNIINVY